MSSPSVEVKIESPRVRYGPDFIEADYQYETVDVRRNGNIYRVEPKRREITFRTDLKVPKLGVMFVGWGGNNGSTVTAAILANRDKLTWPTKDGIQSSNFYGSLTQCSTIELGTSCEKEGEIYVGMRDLLPFVDPVDLIVDGWDISSLDLAGAMKRARVLDVNLQTQLQKEMSQMFPRAAIYDKQFIAANQETRADNIIPGTRQEQLIQLRKDISQFKKKVDKVIVLWSGNTECFSPIRAGLNDTSENLLRSIRDNSSDVSPSTIYAVAAILEGCPYINGSPQNTFVPGCLRLAEERAVFIGGDDFKSGQTKIKSVLVDFLVGAGIKPLSIVSYNHLGNNDGQNLSSPGQFRSKEISKSNVVDDVVKSNSILYRPGEKPDHCVVIKYVPSAGDTKRAMDEYSSEIMLGGRNTLVLHNTCEDSLLAAPLILDLILLTEIFQRITFKVGPAAAGGGVEDSHFQSFHSVLSSLGYLCKAPLVPAGSPVVNALFKQRASLENLFRACSGLGPLHHIGLQFKSSDQTPWKTPDENKDNLRVLRNGKIQDSLLENKKTTTKMTLGRGLGQGEEERRPNPALF